MNVVLRLAVFLLELLLLVFNRFGLCKELLAGKLRGTLQRGECGVGPKAFKVRLSAASAWRIPALRLFRRWLGCLAGEGRRRHEEQRNSRSRDSSEHMA